MQPSLWMYLKKKRLYAIDHFSQHIMPLLVSVEELTLLLDRDDLLQGSLPLVSDALWTSFNPRLRKLNYKGTIYALQRILSPPLRYNFTPPPSLTHLALYFQVPFQWSDVQVPLRWLASPIANIAFFVALLQCLEQTLESLSLQIPAHLESTILLELPHFPCLEHLDIRLHAGRLGPGVGVAVTSFLAAHREYLQTLTLLLLPTPLYSFQIYQDFCNISFPFLHTLVLDWTQFFVERTQAFPHVPRLHSFVSGAGNLDEATIMKIRERASPSQPTIVWRRNTSQSELNAELGYGECNQISRANILIPCQQESSMV